MPKTVDFYFDFGSPSAYLAWRRIDDVAVRTGATVRPIPFLLGGLFKATGNNPPGAVPAKGLYVFKDLQRFARKFAVPLTFNEAFPINTITLMRGAAGYQGTADFRPYCDAVFDAMWRDNRNAGDPAVLAAILAEAGLDAARFEALIGDSGVKERLKTQTEEAAARGAFGAPTFFVGDEMFFGQDRLDFVEEALA